MKVIIDSAEPLDHVLAVIRAVYQIPRKGALPPAVPVTAASLASRNTVAVAHPPSVPAAVEPPDPVLARPPAARENTAARRWAREQGFAVSSRGRISDAVLSAYRYANPSTAPQDCGDERVAGTGGDADSSE